MKDICSQCHFCFRETSIQFNRRMRTSSPILCQECYRINHADSRAIKRQITPKSSEDKMEALIKGYGTVSPSLLMMKFKITYDEAVSKMNQLRA